MLPIRYTTVTTDFDQNKEIFKFLMQMSDAYPGIDQWFLNKVVPNLGTTRYITTIKRHGNIVAVGIAKNEDGEKKLCTVRVADAFKNRGLGVRVMDDLMKYVNTNYPLATVCEEMMPSFDRIFSKYGFCLTSVVNGMYRKGKVEFVFNEQKTLTKH
jgi:hypothetical protein